MDTRRAVWVGVSGVTVVVAVAVVLLLRDGELSAPFAAQKGYSLDHAALLTKVETDAPERVAAPEGSSTKFVAPVVNAPAFAATSKEASTIASGGQSAEWLQDLSKECGVSPDGMLALEADVALLEETKRVWSQLSAQVWRTVDARATAISACSRRLQKLGRFELIKPGMPLPDADARLDEWIEFGYQKNPEGGRDLVRVIRILPGEDAAVDAARGEELLARSNRRAVIRSMLRL